MRRRGENIRVCSPTPGHDALIHRLALVFVFLMVFLSPLTLGMIGWNYDAPGGSGPTRFHPATLTILLLFLLILVREGNPLAAFFSFFARDTFSSLFLLIWMVVLYHGIVVQGMPAAGLVDTFLLPLLMLMSFRQFEERTKKRIAALLHVAFALNAIIGIGEFATGLRLTPLTTGGVELASDWRSSALLGHPLGNALLTGCYAIALMLGGGGALSVPKRAAMLMLQFAGMVAFGGRASLVLLLAFAGFMALRQTFTFLAGRKVPLVYLAAGALLLPTVLALLAGAYELGVFDKFIQRFVDDGGSANARLTMFELFQGFSWQELLFGPQQGHLTYLTLIWRIEFGIESFWIAFSLYYGIIPATIFFLGLLFFLVSVTLECQRRAWIILSYFFIVNSTFVGIAGKTVGFSIMLLMLLALLPAVRVAPLSRPATPVGNKALRNPLPC
ncbi:MAG: VpsF family polysaccharide biosynthesis protein [Proteobacteria bacterium]|nr:VpsF family polysaccharide biosynthesis protein [Pseudomonadota bacterium]